MNKGLDDFLYKKEQKEAIEDLKIKRFLRNGYCPSCNGRNLKISHKFLMVKIKYTCKDCGFTFECY